MTDRRILSLAALVAVFATTSLVPVPSPACSPYRFEAQSSQVGDLGVVEGSGPPPVVRATHWNVPAPPAGGCGGDQGYCAFITFKVEVESGPFAYALVDAPYFGRPRYLRLPEGTSVAGVAVREVIFGADEVAWLEDGGGEFDLALVDADGRRTPSTRVVVPRKYE